MLKKQWGPVICSWIPLDLWHRLLNVEVILPYYHMVGDQEPEHVSELCKVRSVRRFKDDLEFFLRHYTPISLNDLISYLDGSRQLPRRCFLLTFDDGFREIHDVVAPILHARGIPAVFFLTTSVIDNRELAYPQKISLLIRASTSLGESPLKREVLQLLSNAGVNGPDLSSRIRSITYRQRHVLDEVGSVLECDFSTYTASTRPYLTYAHVKDLMGLGFAIGAHSVDHPPYSELNIEEQLQQTHESVSWLSNRFKYECQAFAFPFRDAGVSPQFFERAFADGRIKVSFGTGGMHRHFFPRNLTRYTMEDADRDAAHILAREFCLTVLRTRPWARP